MIKETITDDVSAQISCRLGEERITSLRKQTLNHKASEHQMKKLIPGLTGGHSSRQTAGPSAEALALLQHWVRFSVPLPLITPDAAPRYNYSSHLNPTPSRISLSHSLAWPRPDSTRAGEQSAASHKSLEMQPEAGHRGGQRSHIPRCQGNICFFLPRRFKTFRFSAPPHSSRLFLRTSCGLSALPIRTGFFFPPLTSAAHV